MSAIGNVGLNMDYYTGVDLYSDGEIEEELLRIVQNHKDFRELLKKDSRWPILYHLSTNRRNLLDWLEFPPEHHVLEVGAGCGALTGLLCEKAHRVVAIELSHRRALINATRHQQFNNLEIIVGNFNDIPLPEKAFDCITLIGVLEYASSFTKEANPHLAFLKKIKKLLRANGQLIVAIENRYGLKYWAGAREDHSGEYFSGIQNYHFSKHGARTFSKPELEALILSAGYLKPSFYYPVPDYKLPTQIFSDDFLPKTGDVNSFAHNYDHDRLNLFDENVVFENLVKDRKFDFFSNSFLVVCETE